MRNTQEYRKAYIESLKLSILNGSIHSEANKKNPNNWYKQYLGCGNFNGVNNSPLHIHETPVRVLNSVHVSQHSHNTQNNTNDSSDKLCEPIRVPIVIDLTQHIVIDEPKSNNIHNVNKFKEENKTRQIKQLQTDLLNWINKNNPVFGLKNLSNTYGMSYEEMNKFIVEEQWYLFKGVEQNINTYTYDLVNEYKLYLIYLKDRLQQITHNPTPNDINILNAIESGEWIGGEIHLFENPTSSPCITRAADSDRWLGNDISFGSSTWRKITNVRYSYNEHFWRNNDNHKIYIEFIEIIINIVKLFNESRPI
jgi:hypothetical protein